MSKLFKLKQWLTLEEAATYLSSALSERVNEADIFRFALDQRLIISVYFLHPIQFKHRKVVPLRSARFPGLIPDFDQLFGFPINETEMLAPTEKARMVSIQSGNMNVVFDLPMLSGEFSFHSSGQRTNCGAFLCALVWSCPTSGGH